MSLKDEDLSITSGVVGKKASELDAGEVSAATIATALTSQTGGMDAVSVGAALQNASPVVTISSGLTVAVAAIEVDGFVGAAGTIALIPNGTWFVGFDLFSKEVIALPRLGHRGWIPLAECITDDTTATVIRQIAPALPTSRIPRSISKIDSGEGLNVLILGSSLAEGTSDLGWAGMLLNGTSDTSDYKIPGTVTYTNAALGGAPNQYGLAQLGFHSSHSATAYHDSGYPHAVGLKGPLNGRSNITKGVDLAIITVLANGGDKRLDCIEPTIRLLRQQGIEVIVTTDNAQGSPFADYAAMTSAGLYIDQPLLVRLADLYGVELADTAAYVADATLRYPNDDIYRDSIHMFAALPSGRTGQPSGGYEVWARAIRSVIPIDATEGVASTLTYDFANDDPAPFYVYQRGTPTADNGGLRVTKVVDEVGQWGAKSLEIPPVLTGDTVRVTGTITTNGGWNGAPVVGLQGGGSTWGSNSSLMSGTFDVTLTATRDNVDSPSILLFGNHDAAPVGSEFYITNLVIETSSTAQTPPYMTLPTQKLEQKALPDYRRVTDFTIPGDAFVTLPSDERYVATSNPNAGTLVASPKGANSFARRASPELGETQDMLSVGVGKRASMSGVGIVGAAIIYHGIAGEPEVTFDIYMNNSFAKTITIPAQTLTREMYLSLYTPTEWNAGNGVPSNRAMELRVTSGTLNISAFVFLTSAITYVQPEVISYIGTWTDKVVGGAPNMQGYATDTANDYATVTIGEPLDKLYWLLSSKPNSKPVDFWAGRERTTGSATVGTNHIAVRGGYQGLEGSHYIRLAETLEGGGDSSSGYGLHIGGLILVHDR